MTAIAVRGLRKSYGELEAVRGVDFEIEEGEVFGLLGPNGAGKTTTVEILEGYRKRDAGEVTVLGHDPQRPGRGVPRAHRRRAPAVGALAEPHRARDARVFAGYYEQPRDVDEVIALVGLEEKRDARVKTLSGGQKRRLDLGVALVGDPDLVFLDEPTTGFDPAARRAAWEMIRSLRALGKTVLLTTHYLDEAEQLADRVAVLREGRDRPHRHAARADVGRARGRDPLPPRRRGDPRAHERADARAARADERGARRAARSSSGSRCGGRRSKTSTSSLAARSRASERCSSTSSRTQQLVFWRSREAALFIFLFPLLLFVLLGSVYNGKIYGVPAPQALLAGLIGYGCANTAFAGLAITLVLRREPAILKRLRATPLPAVDVRRSRRSSRR